MSNDRALIPAVDPRFQRTEGGLWILPPSPLPRPPRNCAEDGHAWEFKLYSAYCPSCKRKARTDPRCQACERGFPDNDPPPHECPDLGRIPAAVPLDEPGLYPFRVISVETLRGPSPTQLYTDELDGRRSGEGKPHTVRDMFKGKP